MSVSSAAPVNETFSQRFYEVINDPGEAFEGALWGGFLAIEAYQLKSALSERIQLNNTSFVDQKKEQKIWEANKNLFLSTFSFSSMAAITCDWLKKVELISLGSFAPFISSIGYGGRFVVCSSRLWDNLKEFKQGFVAYRASHDPGVRREIFKKQIQNLLKIAFYACFAAWGALGMIHALIGGDALFAIVDTLFMYTAIFFVGNLVFAMIQYRPKKLQHV